MIYLFTGTDTEKARAKAFQWVSASRQKAPEAPYLRLAASEITENALAEAAGSQGLFFARSLVLLDDPFSDKSAGETVLEHLVMLKDSANPIALLAPKLIAAHAKKLEAVSEKVFSFDLKEKAPSRGFNSALVNALGTKDGAALWKEIVKAYRLGDAPEMVHGLLHFKARDMMEKGNAKWGREGARLLSVKLIELLSDSRRGDLPLAEGLERFALSM